MITLFITLITFLSTFFAVFHFVSSFRYRREPRGFAKEKHAFSIIVPCYNEARILPNTIRGIRKMDYDRFEVIFINDGSTDQTFKVLDQELGLAECIDEGLINPVVRGVYQSFLYPNIYVIDKENTGKADSLNKGIRFCHFELVVTLDGDCILEKDALSIMNESFQDEDVIASGGAVHVMQYLLLSRKSKAIIALQALDFIKGFYIYKASLAFNNALSIISGAFGVFRKDALMAVQGFRKGLGEDIDITLRLQDYASRHNKRVTYQSNAVCYTECPENLHDLMRQRIRWQKAFIDAVIHNHRFLFRNFFRFNVCFFMIADALFSGTMAVLCFLFNYILIAMKCLYGFSPAFIIFLILAVMFNIANSIVAIYRAKKTKPTLGLTKVVLMILPDIIGFSFLRICFFLRGTLSYGFDHKEWNKVERTSNFYEV